MVRMESATSSSGFLINQYAVRYGGRVKNSSSIAVWSAAFNPSSVGGVGQRLGVFSERGRGHEALRKWKGAGIPRPAVDVGGRWTELVIPRRQHLSRSIPVWGIDSVIY
jgi:hypothetical protein